MSNLESLERQIQQRLNAVTEKDRSQQNQLHSKMAEIEKRHAQFEQLAEKLMADIIGLRMAKLASFFENAELLERNEAGRHYCECRFNHSARYPASVTLTLSVAHDAEIKNLLLVYDLEILPIFFRFSGHDQAVVPLDAPNHQQIAAWVDEKILAFVDTYLRLEQTEQYQRSTLVTDPVCGMRFRRCIASTEVQRDDHTYFFCSPGCRDKFTAEPQRYVQN